MLHIYVLYTCILKNNIDIIDKYSKIQLYNFLLFFDNFQISFCHISLFNFTIFISICNFIIIIEQNRCAMACQGCGIAIFFFSITKQWKASPKSSIVKSPQRNNQSGSTFPLLMKRIPSFRLVGKRFYDSNAPPCKAVFLILLILHGGFYYV